MKSLIQKAKSGTLLPEEFQGGSASVSNLGMYNIPSFKAIVNPPQSCIIAVGAGEKRAIVTGDKVSIANMMTVTMSCDHRVIDGSVAALLLNALKKYIEKPILMFV